jgi:hypothetical protein
MRTARIFFALFLVVSAACSSNSASLAPSTSNASAPQVRYAGSPCPASVVYVVAIQAPSIAIYDPAHLRAKPCGNITRLQTPEGLFVDSHGNLWVADALAQKVYEFAPGQNAPKQTLTDPNGQPYAVTINEAAQAIYVTEYQNNVNPSTLVEIYANGSTVPTGSLSDPDARNGGYAALDNQGNLYVTFMTQSNTAQVDRWMHGTGTPANLRLKGLVSSGAIATTATGALAVCDPYAFRCGIFEKGSVKMSHVFGHMGRFMGMQTAPDKAPFIRPNALALQQDERRAYVLAPNSISKWSFPGPNHKPNHLPLLQVKVPGGGGDGIAIDPPAHPGAPY